ncbi:MAG TPA: sodium:solute symporter family protein [Blastocatellia bacterium]|nr:sodium:solute symporter family protein [Blastocatellia bacterium]
MRLTFIDWAIIASYFALSLAIGLYYARRAGRSTEEFFLSDRSMPWWLAGTSMVATTFAADTPLVVTGLVANNGVAGNWLWWNFVASGILTVFFFARLWRRSGVMTDVELAELRYTGRPAAFLRGFRALYLGLPINCIIMGWVTLAMVKVLNLSLGIDAWQATFLCLGITAVYVVISGYWGVVVTDAVQFVIAMIGCIVLAYYSVERVGGMDRLVAGVTEHFGSADKAIGLWPGFDSPWLPAATFAVYLGVQWWASWYPGAEPGGGGYIAQRIFSAKNEKHGLMATLWFNVAHYALRPWPWIITALCTVVLYPTLADKESGYVRIMLDVLPAGLLGLLLASFAAAYMSTIATQLNWGTSYIINDFYRRFIKRDASERHYVLASRIATVLLVLLSGLISLGLESIRNTWELLLGIGAGTGLVFILRWYWWRINAWSEISAMAAAMVVSLVLRMGKPFFSERVFGLTPGAQQFNELFFAYSLLLTVAITTVVWLAVTFATAPEPQEKLLSFYRKVRPGGPGWRAIAEEMGEVEGESLAPKFMNWILGCVLVYSFLFGIGEIVMGEIVKGGAFIAAGLVAGIIIFRNLERTGWSEPVSESPVPEKAVDRSPVV